MYAEKKNKQKKTTRSKCTAVNLVQRQNQAFFFIAFVLLSLLFFSMNSNKLFALTLK